MYTGKEKTVPVFDWAPCAGGVDMQLHMFLICAADEAEQSASYLGHYVNEESEPSTHYIGWMGPRTIMGAQENRKISYPSWN